MLKKDFTILGIESTCDETSAAVLAGGKKLLSNVIYSQIEEHKKYHGVVPELASRAHAAKIATVITEALGKEQIDCVAFDGQRFQCAVACLLFRDGFDLLNSEFCQI